MGRGQAVHPSCPSSLAGRTYLAAGQAASALHSTAVLQVFQAKKLVNEEVGLDVASLRALRSVTDLALRATKATAQAIERPAWHHLWLTMAVGFLNALVSSGSLFGPAVEGFAERFTEAQKLSQVMRHWTSVFSRGAIKSPPTLVPLLPWSSWRAHNIVAFPPHYHPSRNDPASLDAVWEISKENVLVYYRNLGSLRYGTSPAFLDVLWAARLSRFIWRNLRRGGEEMPLLSWRAMAGCICRAICSFYSTARTNGCAVTLRD